MVAIMKSFLQKTKAVGSKLTFYQYYIFEILLYVVNFENKLFLFKFN